MIPNLATMPRLKLEFIGPLKGDWMRTVTKGSENDQLLKNDSHLAFDRLD